MWPNAKISVMGGEQAANVLHTVKLDQLQREGKSLTEEESYAFKKPILSDYEKKSSSLYSSARLWDDGIIDPKDTRKVVGISLSIVHKKENDIPKFGIFRM